MNIVNAIKSQNPPGRFLELEPHLGSWTEVDDTRAIEKTCQTFRKKGNNNNNNFASIKSNKKMNDQWQSDCFDDSSNIRTIKNFASPASSIEFSKKLNSNQSINEHKASFSVNNENKHMSALSMHNEFIFEELRKYYSCVQESSSLDDAIHQCLVGLHEYPLHSNETLLHKMEETEVTECMVEKQSYSLHGDGEFINNLWLI